MSKLTKQQRKLHQEAVECLQHDTLSDDQKELVLNQWHEGADCNNGRAGAFFTPLDLAWDFALAAIGELNPNIAGSRYRVIDLCAGIGSLSYAVAKRYPGIEIVCVEANSAYCDVGRKVVPEATWLCLDINDIEAVKQLGRFDYAISNPPYGNVASLKNLKTPHYTGSHAEFKVMELAAHLASCCTFLVPAESSPHQCSGLFGGRNTNKVSSKLKSFIEQTGLELSDPMSIDTSMYGDFKDLKIRTEIVDFYTQDYQQSLLRGTVDDMFGDFAAA